MIFLRQIILLINLRQLKSHLPGMNELRLFVAAKEVETIDGYAANQNIKKFDLVIDWGWFYFFTKPLFLS